MYHGKKKAVTFSYDDGTTQDIRLVEIFNKYGLKATFNINSELLGTDATLLRCGKTVLHNKVKAEDVRHIYAGHEVAAHSLTHPHLPRCSDEEVIRQVEQDRLNLSELVWYEVEGMAYPGGSFDDRVVELLKKHTGIRYSRVVETTLGFAPCRDFYRYRGTVYHHEQWEHLQDLAEKFLAAEEGVFYIWGHSFEFDIFPERWQQFEEFCSLISGREDIFYGTNREILLPDRE